MSVDDNLVAVLNREAATPHQDSENRRAHPRYTVDEDSTLLRLSPGLPLKAHILNLGLEGCCLRTQERYTAGARMRVEVAFRVNGIAFRFLGIVQWTDGRNLLGIRFVDMLSRRREQLVEVICELEAAAAAKAAKEAADRDKAAANPNPETPFGEPVSDLFQDSAATQIEPPQAVVGQKLEDPAPAAETTADDPPLNLPVQRDRRARSRHAVDTNSTIILVKIGSKISGRIADLSLSGCRIRCNERFPVGIYTRVEIEFRIEGLPFRLGGVVQVIHDRYTVGIRFLDMSARKREQVEQLIGEIRAFKGTVETAGDDAISG